MELSRRQWLVLDSLADGSEPIEEVYFDYTEGRPVEPIDFLGDILSLYRRGFVVVYQAPLAVFEQAFPKRLLEPSAPLDIVGDLQFEFEAFCQAGAYLSTCAEAGVPLGIYIEVTEDGRVEWNQDEYLGFVAAEDR